MKIYEHGWHSPFATFLYCCFEIMWEALSLKGVAQIVESWSEWMQIDEWNPPNPTSTSTAPLSKIVVSKLRERTALDHDRRHLKAAKVIWRKQLSGRIIKIKICRTRIITQLLFQVNLKCWEFDQALILVMTLLGFGFVITLVVRPSVEAMEVLSINRNDQENMNAIVVDDFLCLVISWILDDAPSLSTNSHRNFDSELLSWYFAEDTLGLCK